MWQPTHLQVTVQRAKNINYKGKNDTNDAFVVIALGKDKFQTSIKEKATSAVEWHEECELAIPSQGNTASVSLTVYHRNALGMDEFLGQIQMGLSEFDVYERPRNRWHRLKGKPEKDRKKGEKERGELEIKVAFTVKSGSLLDVDNKKDKNKSITSLKNLGGSLMSLGSKEKANLKSFAKSVSHKIDKIAQKPGKKRSRKSSEASNQGFPQELGRSRQRAGDADPGVISDSDEDDFGFDEEVRVNTGNSSPYSTVSRGSSVQEDEGGRHNGSHFLNDSRAPPKPARLGGNVVEVPTIALESPVPTPSPEPSPIPIPRRQLPATPIDPPTTSPPNTPLTFPNLTPINFPTNNNSNSSSRSPRHSASSDSALTLSLTSSVTKDMVSLASLESSPEPSKEVFPEPPAVPNVSPPVLEPMPPPKLEPMPPPRKTPPKVVDVQEDPKPEPTPLKEILSNKNMSQNSPSTLKKPVLFTRSTSATEPSIVPTSPPPKSEPLLVAPSPNKNRSHSTSSTPKILEKRAFSFPGKDSKESSIKKGSALAALASAPFLRSEEPPPPSSPTNTFSSELTSAFNSPINQYPINQNGVEAPPTPSPSTPSASVYSYESGSGTPSGPPTPLDSSCGPSPASRPASGTPGLAERPGAAVVRSGSLHEKPTTQPVIDEWERKLYGRNAMVGSMENVHYSDSRSSLNTSQSSSTQDVARFDDHGSRFPGIKAIKLEKKTKEETDEGDSKKQRRGKGGGLKNKLFGSSSRERIGEEDSRVVEGGNDRLPHAPTHQSRLPQEIHDKFSGKSREDLMEMIVALQSSMEKSARHARDLEDYIDGLLLRVMETTPQILQAQVNKGKKFKIFGLH